MSHSIRTERDIIWEDTTAYCSCGWSDSHEGYAALLPKIEKHFEENGLVFEEVVEAKRIGLFGSEM